MHTEFVRTEIPRDVRALVAFDHKVFRPADWYSAEQWRTYESYWLLVEGRKLGCCAFHPHTDFTEDLTKNGVDPPLRGSLHIVSSGIDPKYQGQGWGTVMKAWQVAYAKRHGFTRMITACRKSNRAMIGLNERFGFEVLRTTRGYYREPVESIVVLELRLT